MVERHGLRLQGVLRGGRLLEPASSGSKNARMVGRRIKEAKRCRRSQTRWRRTLTRTHRAAIRSKMAILPMKINAHSRRVKDSLLAAATATDLGLASQSLSTKHQGQAPAKARAWADDFQATTTTE